MKASPSPRDAARPEQPAHLYLWALVVILVVRIGLTLFGYQKLVRFMPRPAARKDARFTPWQVAWTVKRMAVFVPWASCLTQALSLQYLLGQRGETSCICIGVTPGAAGNFAAHAWVLWDDQVIIGGHKNLPDYTTIARLEAKTS